MLMPAAIPAEGSEGQHSRQLSSSTSPLTDSVCAAQEELRQKRRREEEEEEDEDSALDDFVVDDEEGDWRDALKSITGYDPSRSACQTVQTSPQIQILSSATLSWQFDMQRLYHLQCSSHYGCGGSKFNVTH